MLDRFVEGLMNGAGIAVGVLLVLWFLSILEWLVK